MCYSHNYFQLLIVSNMRFLHILVPLLQGNAQSITILEGQSINLQCIPIPGHLMVQWSFNGMRVQESEVYTLSPPNLNHTLTITDAEVEDGGEYTCYVMNFQMLVNTIITLNVLPSNESIIKFIVCTVQYLICDNVFIIL